MPDDASAKPNDQLLADRRRKLDRLRDEFGVDPYGHRLDGVTDLARRRRPVRRGRGLGA